MGVYLSYYSVIKSFRAVLSVKMIIENQYFHHVLMYATQIRGVAAGIIFDKSLRLASDENAAGVGSMLNLMQTDASVLENTALQLHTLWDGPLQVCAPMFILTI